MTVTPGAPFTIAVPDGRPAGEEYTDAGHLLNLERPTRFNEDLLSFLA